MLVQNSLAIHLISNFAGIMCLINQEKVLATPCQVYPSEYAYHNASVTRAESASANCRSYPPSYEHYIHCAGTQLKLIDFNFGQEQYQPTDFYQWTTGKDELLLFMFPTRVSLTTITLHYYSDSDRGRPRLRFYAVPDDFDVWDAPTTNTPDADVASESVREPAGHRSVSINVIDFNTMKVLMYKYSSSFQFAVSEVEFFNKCMQAATTEVTTISTTTISSSSTSSVQTMPNTKIIISDFTELALNNDTKMLRGRSQTQIITIIVPTVGLLILSSALIIAAIVVIRNYSRRSAKQKLDTDAPYSTLNRGSRLQVQPQYIQQNSNELYNQIHLSPSTGQTEFIPKPQTENIYNPPYNSHPTHPDIENSATNESAESQINSPMATYAAIDKSNIKKKAKKDDTKHTAAEKHTLKVSSSRGAHADNSTKSHKSLDDTYAPDDQDQERANSEQESNPPHPVEELYTVVKKKSKGSSAPVNESVPQMAEDLYTAVMKKPKENSVNDEVVPPIPPHTVEELYTAVHKKPKGNTMEDEEEVPPIPPLTVEDTF